MKIPLTLCTAFLAAVSLVLLSGCSKEAADVVTDPPVSTGEIIFNPNLTYGTMTDQSGITYKTIRIGTQTWMAENLRTTKYRNLQAITNVAGDNLWSTLIAGAYCSYLDSAEYVPVYGMLYNWYAVSSSKILAPTGWHVSTDADWQTLLLYLDAHADFSSEFGVVSTSAGGKLKEMGTAHWFSPNMGATNETGFTALPGGGRDSYSGFDLAAAGKSGMWWTSSENVGSSIYYDLSTKNNAVYRGTYPKTSGYSVRCVKD